MFSNNTTRRNNNTNTSGANNPNNPHSSNPSSFLCQCETCTENRNTHPPSTTRPSSTTISNMPTFFDISFNIYMEPHETEDQIMPLTIQINPRIYNIIDNFQIQFEEYQNNLRRTLNTITDTMNDYAYNYADYQYYICTILQTILRIIQANTNSAPSSQESNASFDVSGNTTTPQSNTHRTYVPSPSRRSNTLTNTLLDFVVREIENSFNGEQSNNGQTPLNASSDSYRNVQQTASNASSSQNTLYNTIISMVNSQLRTNLGAVSVPTSTRLTNDQIRCATRILQYTNDYNEQRCPISLDEFIVGENICQIKHCSHIFKNNCLMNWLRNKNHCPVCRYDLSTYSESSHPTRTHSSNEPSSSSSTQSTHIRYQEHDDVHDESDENRCDSIPFFNTFSPSPPPPEEAPSSNDSTSRPSLYNLFSTGIDILPINHTSREALLQMNSLFQNTFESALFPASSSSSRRQPASNDMELDVYPQQPDVD